ncbi:GumC family protein [Devosia sp.]|uniref:GumC family protein n=1 Tax=Devosia sp. TaxID=1871048 RepID=UPI002FCA295E
MDETTIDLRQIFELLRRQLRLIAVTVIAVMVISGFVVFSLAPVYTSSALILVDPSRKNLLAGDAQAMGSTGDSARIDSEVEILRSDNVLLKVIESENLLANADIVSLSLTSRILAFLRLGEPELPTAEQALSQALTTLRSSVSVQRRGLTYLISIQARSGDPAQSAQLANAVATAYIQDQLSSKIDSSLASRDLLQAGIAQARQAMISSEGSFDAFIEQNIQQLADAPGGTQVASIRDQIAQLEQARSRNAQLADTVRQDLTENDWASLVDTLGSTALTQLEQQRADLLARLDGSPANSPAATDLTAALAELDERLRTTASSEVEGLQASIAQSQQRETELRSQLRTAVLGSQLSTDTLTQLYSLQQGAEGARRQYDTLLARVQDVETQADLQLADSRIVSAALPPLSPSFPNKPLLLAIAGILALALGVALAFLYDSLIGGFTSETQLSSVLRTRTALAVPRVRAKSEKESLANLMATAPLSIFPESIRRIRVALEQSIRASRDADNAYGGKVIVVSSTAPNEGKTTLALALARSYALSGHSTLLIDCDLRKPSLHRHLGIEPSRGLLDFLDNEEAEDLSAIVNLDSLSPLTSIVGARRSDVPTDQLLAGPSFTRLMRAARSTFDFVVIDTPPVGPVVDSLYVAPFADAILFVTRWASTSQLDAKRAVADLVKSKAPNAEIIGVVNQQDQARASYVRRYSGYYATAD